MSANQLRNLDRIRSVFQGRRAGALAIVLLGTTALGGAAHAQSATPPVPPSATPDTGNQIQEIVVTSRRVTEKLQTTGVSVAAFTAKDLNALGITTLADISRNAPNVIIDTKSGSPSLGLTIKIRGIGVSNVDFLYSDPSVGLYIDGVFQPRAFGPQFDLFQLDRVEVLRGPQGTLYGKNSLGGAINLITRKPDAAPSAEMTVSGGNYGTFNFVGSANGPIVDGKLFGSIAVSVLKHDGYYRNTYLAHEDSATGNRQSVRGALRWLPTPGLTVDAVSTYTHQAENPDNYRMEAIVPGGFFGKALTAAGYNPNSFVVGAHPSASQLSTIQIDNDSTAGSFLPANRGERGRSEDNMDFFSQSLVITGDLSPTTTIRSTTGYSHFKRFVADDLDGTPVPLAAQVKSDHGQAITSELQLNHSFFDNRINLVVGVFGMHETLHEDQANDYLLANQPLSSALDSRQVRSYDNASVAGFSHVIFNLTDRFRLTAGVRYSWERKEINEDDGPLVTENVFTLVSGAQHSWRSVTPQFGAEYEVTHNLFTYATISKGYASGGFAPALASIGGPQVYNPESLWNYEAGIKTDFFNRALQFNASGFYMDYTNVVEQSFGTAPSGAIVNLFQNSGKARVKGLEADVEAKPFKGLTLNAGMGLLDQKFLTFGLGANGVPIPPSSAHFWDSPGLTTNASIQYTLPIEPEAGKFTIEGGWSYRSRTYFDNTNTITSSQDPYSLYDAHLIYEVAGRPLTFEFFVQNLTNKVYVTRTLNALASPLGFALVEFGLPRTFGGSVKYKF